MKKNTIIVIILAVSFIILSSGLTIFAILIDENSKSDKVEQIVLEDKETFRTSSQPTLDKSNTKAHTDNQDDKSDNHSKDESGKYNIIVKDGVEEADCNISYEQAVSLGLKAIEKETGIDCSAAVVNVTRYNANESTIWNCVAEDGKYRFEFRVNANSGKILKSDQYELEDRSDYVWILKSNGGIVEKKIDQQKIQAYKSLTIKADSNMNVEIQGGKSYSINAKYYGENYQVVYEIVNGVMKIETEGYSDELDNVSNTLTLTIPEDVTLEKINVSQDYGNFTMDRIFADNVDVDLELGTLTMNEVTSNDNNLYIGTGDAQLSDVVSSNNTLNVSAGNVRMDNCTSKVCKITLDMGDAKLKGKLFGNTEFRATLGSIELNCTEAAKNYNYVLKTDMGTVSVNGKDSTTKLSSNNNAANSINVSTGMGKADLNFE